MLSQKAEERVSREAAHLSLQLEPFVAKLMDATVGKYTVVQDNPTMVRDFLPLCRSEVETVLNAVVNHHFTDLAAAERQAVEDAREPELQELYEEAMRKEAGIDAEGIAKSQADAADAAASPGCGGIGHRKSLIGAQEVTPEEMRKQLQSVRSSELYLRSIASEMLVDIRDQKTKMQVLDGLITRRDHLLRTQKRAFLREMSHLREMLRQWKTNGRCDIRDARFYEWEEDKVFQQQQDELNEKIQEALTEVKQRHEAESAKQAETHQKQAEELRRQIQLLELQVNALSTPVPTTTVGCDALEQPEFAEACMQTDYVEMGSGSGYPSLPHQTALARHGLPIDLEDDGRSHSPSHRSSNSTGATPTHSTTLTPRRSFGQLRQGAGASGPPSARSVASEMSHAAKSSTTTPRKPIGDEPIPTVDITAVEDSDGVASRTAELVEKDKKQPASKLVAHRPHPKRGGRGGSRPTSAKRPVGKGSKQPGRGGTASTSHTPNAQPSPSPMGASGTSDAYSIGDYSQTSFNRDADMDQHEGSQSTDASIIAPATSALLQEGSRTILSPGSSVQQSDSRKSPGGQKTPRESGAVDAELRPFSGGADEEPNRPHRASIAISGDDGGAVGSPTQRRTSRFNSVSSTNAAMQISTENARSELFAVRQNLHRVMDQLAKRDGEINALHRQREEDKSRFTKEESVAVRKLNEELRQRSTLLDQKTHELEQIRAETERWFKAYRQTQAPDQAPVNYGTLRKLTSCVAAAEESEAEYRSLSWRLLENSVRFDVLLSNQVAECDSIAAQQPPNPAALSRAQHQCDVLVSHYRNVLARLRQRRARTKLAANRRWDAVLFYARSVLHPDDPGVPPPRYYGTTGDDTLIALDAGADDEHIGGPRDLSPSKRGAAQLQEALARHSNQITPYLQQKPTVSVPWRLRSYVKQASSVGVGAMVTSQGGTENLGLGTNHAGTVTVGGTGGKSKVRPQSAHDPSRVRHMGEGLNPSTLAHMTQRQRRDELVRIMRQDQLNLDAERRQQFRDQRTLHDAIKATPIEMVEEDIEHRPLAPTKKGPFSRPQSAKVKSSAAAAGRY